MAICKTNQEWTLKISVPPAVEHSVPQLQNAQHHQLQNSEHSFDVPNRNTEHIKLKKEWEERIEKLKEKYNLEFYSSSESNSDYDPEPDYIYEHKYKTLI